MPSRFQDNVVIVTGSSSGIGRATAVLFAEEGAKLTISGRNERTLENTRDVLISVGCKLDDIITLSILVLFALPSWKSRVYRPRWQILTNPFELSEEALPISHRIHVEHSTIKSQIRRIRPPCVIYVY